jgi:hypothetical protein
MVRLSLSVLCLVAVPGTAACRRTACAAQAAVRSAESAVWRGVEHCVVDGTPPILAGCLRWHANCAGKQGFFASAG